MSEVNQSQETDAAIIDAMEKHLIDKYGLIPFRIIGFIRSGWVYNYDILNLSAELDGVEIPFIVERHRENDGYTFRDSYYAVILCGLVEERAYAVAPKEWGAIRIYSETRIGIYPESLIGRSDLSDFAACREEVSPIGLSVFVTEAEGFEELSRRFLSAWNEEGIPTNVRIHLVDNDLFEKVGRENYYEQERQAISTIRERVGK